MTVDVVKCFGKGNITWLMYIIKKFKCSIINLVHTFFCKSNLKWPKFTFLWCTTRRLVIYTQRPFVSPVRYKPCEWSITHPSSSVLVTGCPLRCRAQTFDPPLCRDWRQTPSFSLPMLSPSSTSFFLFSFFLTEISGDCSSASVLTLCFSLYLGIFWMCLA